MHIWPVADSHADLLLLLSANSAFGAALGFKLGAHLVLKQCPV